MVCPDLIHAQEWVQLELSTCYELMQAAQI
jgi:hypothetical protein